MNAVAAGGTLLTFPTLVWLGLNSITANATSTVAVWPGVMSGVVAYRRELRTLERRFLYLAVPSLIGGLGGAYLLRLTPSMVFDRLVPYLILFATLLFMAQETIQHKMKDAHPGARKSTGWFLGAIVFQLIVGIYGGYFGAGIGILMLAAFGILGMTDIHQMNGFKNLLGGAINLLAAIYFISEKMVYWPDVGIMAL
ncbi:MAG: sulfite exporter TauE/SafE family protein, partial [Bdellovibrionota bacterium]